MRRWSATRPASTRMDGVAEAWRVMGTLLESPPPVHAYKQGSLGAGRRLDDARGAADGLARALDRGLTWSGLTTS